MAATPLTGESWQKGIWRKSIAFRRNRWEVFLRRDERIYQFPPPNSSGSPATRRVYNRKDGSEVVLYKAAKFGATLLFHTWDRRPVTHYRGTDLRIVSIPIQKPPCLIKNYIDPITRRTLLSITKDKEGRITFCSETFYDEPLPDSLFTWEYPLEKSFVAEQKIISRSPEEKQNVIGKSLIRDARWWLMLPRYVNSNEAP